MIHFESDKIISYKISNGKMRSEEANKTHTRRIKTKTDKIGVLCVVIFQVLFFVLTHHRLSHDGEGNEFSFGKHLIENLGGKMEQFFLRFIPTSTKMQGVRNFPFAI